MELAQQIDHAAAVVPLLDVLHQAGVHKAGGLGGEPVIEPAAGDEAVILGAGVQQEDRVVLTQLELVRPGPGGVFYIPALPGYCPSIGPSWHCTG